MKQEIIKYIKNIGKKATIPKKILEHFISHGHSTIPEISKSIGVSLPTTKSTRMARYLFLRTVEMSLFAETRKKSP
jgi:hypothetical protein